MLKYLLASLILMICACSLFAQHISYDETIFGKYVPSPPYINCSVFKVDSFGRSIQNNDSFELNQTDSNRSNIHWENITSYGINGTNRRCYFQTRYEVMNNVVKSKYIRVTQYTYGLLIPSNLWDSAHIFYTYDSTSGRNMYKSILTQLVDTKGGANNYQKTDYYYDGNYSDTLEMYRQWDSTNRVWKDSAKSVAVFSPSMGVPQWYQHYLYSKNKGAWLLHTVDSMSYDSAANPKAICTQVNRNGKLIDSSRRFLKRMNTDTLENDHWLWNGSQWIKDTIAIFYYNSTGIDAKVFKIYDPVSQLVVKAFKCRYANPNYSGIDEDSITTSYLHIYPNPALENVNIEYTLSNAQDADIAIYDLMGRQVKNIFYAKLPEGKHTEEINIQDLPPAMYIVKLQLDGVSQEEKLVKLKD